MKKLMRHFRQWQGILYFFLLVTICLERTESIKWLSLMKSKQNFWNQTKHCMISKRDDGLNKQQVRICKNNLELMVVVAHAAKEVVHVCQSLFVDRRWNCSSVLLAPNYLADLTGGSREQAYIYAIGAAGLAQTMSKACTLGATTKCSCGMLPTEAPPTDFKWGGCSDDVTFGMAFSRMFGDSYSRRKLRDGGDSKKDMVNKHNANAGRRIVANSLKTACKCHGVSGSCSIKTCWKSLQDLKSMGIQLQKRYATAVEVDNKRIKSHKKAIEKSRIRRLVPVVGTKKTFTEDDLIYYTKSSDYCLPDTSLGSLGTRHRECKPDDPGPAGCRSMCCGRGITTHKGQTKVRCDCKYYWCCYVTCRTCVKNYEISRCR